MSANRIIRDGCRGSRQYQLLLKILKAVNHVIAFNVFICKESAITCPFYHVIYHSVKILFPSTVQNSLPSEEPAPAGIVVSTHVVFGHFGSFLVAAD